MGSCAPHAGLTVPIDRKRELYAVCAEYDVVIIEDDPYYYLQFGVRGAVFGILRDSVHRSSNVPNARCHLRKPLLLPVIPLALACERTSCARHLLQVQQSRWCRFLVGCHRQCTCLCAAGEVPGLGSGLEPSYLSIDTDARVVRPMTTN